MPIFVAIYATAKYDLVFSLPAAGGGRHNRVFFAVRPWPGARPDCGRGLYVGGQKERPGPADDLFTSDVGELAFLADEEAPHLFYTRGFILHE